MRRWFLPQAASLLLLLLLGGCARFAVKPPEYLYVSTRQVYLHDRVAAVSNRIAQVTNGERLEMIERGKRFYKVKTAQNQIGWIEQHSVIDGDLYHRFVMLAEQHHNDPVVSTGVLRDDLFVHILPGREQDHFYLFTGNTHVELLARGMAEKTTPGALPPKPAEHPESAVQNGQPPEGAAAPAPPPMEDWWLVRDKNGHTGWVLASRLDIDIPDDVGTYAEGQRIVGAYAIAHVIDNGTTTHTASARVRKGKKNAEPVPDVTGANTPTADPPGTNTPAAANPEKIEYVTLLTPPQNGLPFDFDQVRVFTWSLNHHRYETAYRLHGIEGYLPLRISSETINGQSYPVFSFQVASGTDVVIDPETGQSRPRAMRTLAFRMEGNIVKRTGSDLAPIILLHPSQEPGKEKPKKKKR